MFEQTKTFARRARLSSKAILTAVVLTLAAASALVFASQRQDAGADIKIFSPVTDVPLIKTSGTDADRPAIFH